MKRDKAAWFFLTNDNLLQINVEDANDPNRKSVTAYHYGYMSGNNVIGLEPNTDYWVTVQIFNTAGESNPSEKQLLGTCLNRKIFLIFSNQNIFSFTKITVEHTCKLLCVI